MKFQNNRFKIVVNIVLSAIFCMQIIILANFFSINSIFGKKKVVLERLREFLPSNFFINYSYSKWKSKKHLKIKKIEFKHDTNETYKISCKDCSIKANFPMADVYFKKNNSFKRLVAKDGKIFFDQKKEFVKILEIELKKDKETNQIKLNKCIFELFETRFQIRQAVDFHDINKFFKLFSKCDLISDLIKNTQNKNENFAKKIFDSKIEESIPVFTNSVFFIEKIDSNEIKFSFKTDFAKYKNATVQNVSLKGMFSSEKFELKNSYNLNIFADGKDFSVLFCDKFLSNTNNLFANLDSKFDSNLKLIDSNLKISANENSFCDNKLDQIFLSLKYNSKFDFEFSCLDNTQKLNFSGYSKNKNSDCKEKRINLPDFKFEGNVSINFLKDILEFYRKINFEKKIADYDMFFKSIGTLKSDNILNFSGNYDTNDKKLRFLANTGEFSWANEKFCSTFVFLKYKFGQFVDSQFWTHNFCKEKFLTIVNYKHNFINKTGKFLVSGVFNHNLINDFLPFWWTDFWNNFKFDHKFPVVNLGANFNWQRIEDFEIFSSILSENFIWNEFPAQYFKGNLFANINSIKTSDIIIKIADNQKIFGLFDWFNLQPEDFSSEDLKLEKINNPKNEKIENRTQEKNRNLEYHFAGNLECSLENLQKFSQGIKNLSKIFTFEEIAKIKCEWKKFLSTKSLENYVFFESKLKQAELFHIKTENIDIKCEQNGKILDLQNFEANVSDGRIKIAGELGLDDKTFDGIAKFDSVNIDKLIENLDFKMFEENDNSNTNFLKTICEFLKPENLSNETDVLNQEKTICEKTSKNKVSKNEKRRLGLASGESEMNFKNDFDLLKSYAKGTFRVQSADFGNVYIFGILSKILNGLFLNLKGLKLDKLSFDFELKEGILFVNNLIIEGPQILMNANGKIFLANQKLDFLFKTNPIELIPLAFMTNILRKIIPISHFLTLDLKLSGDLKTPEWKVYPNPFQFFQNTKKQLK